jgi:hypothetical protein
VLKNLGRKANESVKAFIAKNLTAGGSIYGV